MILVRRPEGPSWRGLCHPLEPWQCLWRHRRLIVQLAARDVRSRYRGALLGPLWPLLTPALAILVYTFVFNTILRPRWGQFGSGSTFDFALLLMAGLFVFNVFTEMVARAPHLIHTQPHFVKKIAFPLEVFPAAALLAALVHLAIGLTILLALWVAVHGEVPAGLWLLPVVLIPYAALLLGLGWLLAAGGTFLRDLAPTFAAGAQLLLFLTPVFYPLAAVPAPFQSWLGMNPLAVVVESCRAALLGWDTVSWLSLVGLAVGGWLAAQVGFAGFMALKPRLADVV